MRPPQRTVSVSILLLAVLTAATLPGTLASKKDVLPGTLRVQVVYDTEGGPQRFRTDLQDALVKELVYRGCYEKVVAEPADIDEVIVFRLTLHALLEEVDNNLTIHESIKVRQQTGQTTSSHTARLQSVLELYTPGAREPVARSRMNKRSRYRPQFEWEDGGMQARVDLMTEYVMEATSWVCKQGRKKL